MMQLLGGTVQRKLIHQTRCRHSSLRATIKWYKKAAVEIIFSTMLVNAWVIQNKFSKKN